MSLSLTVAVDANGADAGPAEVARGAALAAESGVNVLIFGPAREMGSLPESVEVVDAPLSIAKSADPARAVRLHPDASIVQAWRAVADGHAQAVVTGGSTGAALAAGLFTVKRARGIHRPALAALVPMPDHPFLLLDAGANVIVRPEHLVQFAHMGAAFMRAALGVAHPRVALLSNGEEAERGREEIVAAHAALSGDAGLGLHFVGNIEGFAIGSGAADVIVTDGFTGNVALKVMEGTSAAIFRAVRSSAHASPRAALGGLLLKPALGDLRNTVDPEAQGGAVLLGLRAVGVMAHGSFSAPGFGRAVELAAQAIRNDLLGLTLSQLGAAHALRPPPPGAEAAVAPRAPEPSDATPSSAPAEAP